MSFSMGRAGGALLAAAAGVLLLAGCQDPDPMTITSAVYSQDQAIEDFDNSEATTDDPEQTAQLAELLHEHGLSGDIELGEDRKSTRLNSSHVAISYAVFCLKKKKKTY